MKDEIKEILCFLADDNRVDERFYKALGKNKCKTLLDYIITLQKENEQLKKRNKEIYDGYMAATQELTEYAEENETLKELNVCVGCNNNPDYKTRIDKAIEYINKVKAINDKEDDDMYWEYEVFFPNMLNILQGDETNE